MSRSLPIPMREAKSYLRAAEAEGGIIKVKVGNREVTFIPAVHAQEEGRIDGPKHRGFLAPDGEEDFDAD